MGHNCLMFVFSYWTCIRTWTCGRWTWTWTWTLLLLDLLQVWKASYDTSSLTVLDLMIFAVDFSRNYRSTGDLKHPPTQLFSISVPLGVAGYFDAPTLAT